MGTGGLRIVPLEAAHLNALVSIHLRAFPGFFLCCLGPRFLKEFYAQFLADSGAVAVVATDETGRICGAVVGTLDPEVFFRRLLVRRWWAFSLASVRVLLQKPVLAPRLFRALCYRGEAPEGGKRALLSSIAVDPARQGAGVGKELVKRWLDEARSRGARGCFLTTDAENNDTVNRFYLSQGWKLESAHTTTEGRKMNRYIYDFVQ